VRRGLWRRNKEEKVSGGARGRIWSESPEGKRGLREKTLSEPIVRTVDAMWKSSNKKDLCGKKAAKRLKVSQREVPREEACSEKEKRLFVEPKKTLPKKGREGGGGKKKENNGREIRSPKRRFTEFPEIVLAEGEFGIRRTI